MASERVCWLYKKQQHLLSFPHLSSFSWSSLLEDLICFLAFYVLVKGQWKVLKKQ